jgi:hypothetical protein
LSPRISNGYITRPPQNIVEGQFTSYNSRSMPFEYKQHTCGERFVSTINAVRLIMSIESSFENMCKRCPPRNTTEGRKRRNAMRKANYARGRKWAAKKRRMYSRFEMLAIRESKLPDRELARIFRRSVQAIQVKRSKLKHHV